MEKKALWKSWTLWVNLLGGMAVASITTLQDYGVDAEWLAGALVVSNVLLRFKTTQPIR